MRRQRWADNAVRTVIWATVPMVATTIGFLTWLLFDGPQECGAVMACAGILALTGGICWNARHCQRNAAGDLLEALLATRPCDASLQIVRDHGQPKAS